MSRRGGREGGDPDSGQGRAPTRSRPRSRARAQTSAQAREPVAATVRFHSASAAAGPADRRPEKTWRVTGGAQRNADSGTQRGFTVGARESRRGGDSPGGPREATGLILGVTLVG